VRIATVAVFAAVAVVGWARFHGGRAHDKHALTRAGEVSVADAVSAQRSPVSVRGWVFNDPALGAGGLRLCNGFRPGSPPSCVGPFVDLYGVDPGSFALRSRSGVRWGEDPIAVYGALDGTALTVQSVLR